jgi:membrane protein implicated in regulation of membrane protease activity
LREGKVKAMDILSNPTMFWLIVMVILIIIEIPTVGLTTIWFAIGALVSVITSLIGLSFTAQVILFLVVSLIMVIFTRPFAMKYINVNKTKTNYERLIGTNVQVIQDIDNISSTGTALVHGQEWTARTKDNSIKIQKGSLAKVVDIQGVKLIVEPITKEDIGE